MIGIYQIKNNINNKLYIGSSCNIEKRFLAHKNLLKRNKHHSIHLQNAWNKYGEENFTFDILEITNIDNLLEKENYFLNTLLKSNEYMNSISDYFIKNSYNICPLAIKGFSGKHQRKTLIKMLKGKNQYKEIFKVDLDNNILEIYDFITDIKESYNSVMYSINNKVCIKHKNYGYVLSENWSDNYKIEKQFIWNKGIKKPTNKGLQVYVYDIYGCFYKCFDTLALCAKHFNTNTASIHRKMNNDKIKFSLKTELSKFNFYYEEKIFDNKLILSNNGNIEVFDIFNNYLGKTTKEEIINKLNISENSVYACISNKRKQIKGYILKKL